MRHDSHHSTLAQLLETHWRRLLHVTSVTEFSFAYEVRDQYEQRVAPTARDIDWSHHPDPVARMRRDAEKLNRWFRDDVNARFPVDALEAFIAAFPPGPRFDLQRALAERQHLLAVPIPDVGPGEDGNNLGRIAKETGEAIIALSHMLDDNTIDERDAGQAESALVEIDQAMAVLAEMRERVINQTQRHR